MKVRESGMPEARVWHTFFDPAAVLDALGLTHTLTDAVDFGCGYGTFATPAARCIQGTLHAFDIDPAMVNATKAEAKRLGLHNLRVHLRDFVAQGTGLEDASVDYAMLFNILHAEDPLRLLREAHRILKPGGRLGVMHWNYDPATPRGPSMAIRPRPENCRTWIEQAGFRIVSPHMELPPYHYGITATKDES
jgi:ubiquinone/menaquinone biosynthesis C-methylase UbiE